MSSLDSLSISDDTSKQTTVIVMLPAWQGSSTEGRPRFTQSDALSAGRHLPRTPAAPCGGGVGGQAGGVKSLQLGAQPAGFKPCSIAP